MCSLRNGRIVPELSLFPHVILSISKVEKFCDFLIASQKKKKSFQNREHSFRKNWLQMEQILPFKS